jgi:2-polyprenyl-6-methoxyphenol hydroxylase-like FAD-dependent oxidoreductase
MAEVLVIGGGLAGMATATLLAMDGHAVTVLERDAAPPPAQVGRWLLDVAGAEILPKALLAQPGVVERILELGDHDGMAQEGVPSRADLLDAMS